MGICENRLVGFYAHSYSQAQLFRVVREHAMGSIANGLVVHGGVIPFTAEQRVIFVFTHDSIALGEDGSTHQPIEQLASLRAIPNLLVIRPCDANETTVFSQVRDGAHGTDLNACTRCGDFGMGS